MAEQSPTTTCLVAELEAAARRWWVPRWLGDLLIRAAAHIEVQTEMARLLELKLEIARGR